MPISERDQAILALRSEGLTLQEIADKYGITRQRVERILKKQGGVSAAESRSIRSELAAKELEAEVAELFGRFSKAIETMAAAGATRDDVEKIFSIMCPDVGERSLSAAIEASDVHFNVVVSDVNFSTEAIEAAAWYAVGIGSAIDGEPQEALPFVEAQLAAELFEILVDLGISSGVCAEILRVIGLARARVASGDELSISKKRYDAIRAQFLRQHGLLSAKGTAVWPPTSQTTMKRLGRGYWTTAMEAVGLQPETGGRERGSLVFPDDAYEQAVADFMAFAAAQSSRPTFAEYQKWVETEDRSQRRRPSGAAVRLRFGSWTDAKRVGQAAVASRPDRPMSREKPVARMVSRAALITAERTLEEELDRLVALPAHEVGGASVEFLRRYLEEFEIARRGWLRAVVSADEAQLKARLAGDRGRLSKAQASEAPDVRNVGTILTDLYLDRLLNEGDPTETDQWLRGDLQAELNRLSEIERRRYAVGRSIRNLATHHSAESRDRVRSALAALAELETGFELRQEPTSRVLGSWLSSRQLRRLRLLCEVIPAVWRLNVVVEALGESPAE